MKLKITRFALFLAVAVVSLIAILFAGDIEAVKSIAQVPFVISVLGALFQLVRDDAAYFRGQQLQEAKHGFALGVESHMSKVAFDKHVAFCEEYGAEIHKTLLILHQHGTETPGLECTVRLFTLRVKHSVWLPEDISKKLKPFEDKVREIQTSKDLAKALMGEPEKREVRLEANRKADRALRIALGEKEWQGEVLPYEGSYKSAHDALKLVIGSEFLMKMRAQIRDLHAADGR